MSNVFLTKQKFSLLSQNKLEIMESQQNDVIYIYI